MMFVHVTVFQSGSFFCITCILSFGNINMDLLDLHTHTKCDLCEFGVCTTQAQKWLAILIQPLFKHTFSLLYDKILHYVPVRNLNLCFKL